MTNAPVTPSVLPGLNFYLMSTGAVPGPDAGANPETSEFLISMGTTDLVKPAQNTTT